METTSEREPGERRLQAASKAETILPGPNHPRSPPFDFDGQVECSRASASNDAPCLMRRSRSSASRLSLTRMWLALHSMVSPSFVGRLYQKIRGDPRRFESLRNHREHLGPRGDQGQHLRRAAAAVAAQVHLDADGREGRGRGAARLVRRRGVPCLHHVKRFRISGW